MREFIASEHSLEIIQNLENSPYFVVAGYRCYYQNNSELIIRTGSSNSAVVDFELIIDSDKDWLSERFPRLTSALSPYHKVVFLLECDNEEMFKAFEQVRNFLPYQVDYTFIERCDFSKLPENADFIMHEDCIMCNTYLREFEWMHDFYNAVGY